MTQINATQMISNWHVFSQSADTALQAAVDEVNSALPPSNTTRISFVSPGFTDRNAIYAEDSFIFGPSFNPGNATVVSQLQPTDPVAQERFGQCKQVYGSPESFDFQKCRLAS